MWTAAMLACTAMGPATDPMSAAALEARTRSFTELGPRMVGTPAEEAAALLLFQDLLETGANTSLVPFVWDAWQPGDASLTVGDQSWPASPLSPAPPVTGLVGALADGDGDLEGAVAIVSADGGNRGVQALAASAGGAVAMIRVTEDQDTDGEPLVEVGHMLDGLDFPAVAVDWQTGTELQRRLGQEVELELDSAILPDLVSHNVVARVPGTGDGRVFVTAHYDSWHNSECAIDNALGSAMLVQLAQALTAGPPPEREVVFLATSGEEQGLQGAQAWVAEHADEARAGWVVLNLDIPWSAEGSFLVGASDSDLRELAMGLAAEEGLDPVDTGSISLASDHVPFVGEGVPAVWLTRQPDRHYHTQRDELRWLDFDQAAASLRVHWALLQDQAKVP